MPSIPNISIHKLRATFRYRSTQRSIQNPIRRQIQSTQSRIGGDGKIAGAKIGRKHTQAVKYY